MRRYVRAGLRRRVRAGGTITPHRREAPSLPAGPGPEVRARARTLGRRLARADPRRRRRAPLRRPLTAANEPEEFFASDFESMAPEEKLKDPLVLLGLGSIFLPFIMILGFQYVAASQGFLLILHLTPRLRGDTPSPRRRLNAWSAQGDGRDLG